jgi:hypothetical protein
MANFVASQAPRNGSTISLGPGSMATAALLGSQGARYDSREFTWVGSLNNDISVAVSRSDSPVSTLDEVFTKELVVGGAGASDNSVVFATILSRMFGAKLKLVAGYNGSGDNVMALDRGEVQGIAGWNYSSITTMRPDWLRDKKINLLVQIGLTKAPDLPDVPLLIDLAKNEEDRAVLMLLSASVTIGRPLYVAPGVPAERVRALRAGGAQIVIALAHDGARCDRDKPDACTGGGISIIDQLTDKPDLFVMGHAHSNVALRRRDMPVVETTSNGRAIAVVDIPLDGGQAFMR